MADHALQAAILASLQSNRGGGGGGGGGGLIAARSGGAVGAAHMAAARARRMERASQPKPIAPRATGSCAREGIVPTTSTGPSKPARALTNQGSDGKPKPRALMPPGAAAGHAGGRAAGRGATLEAPHQEKGGGKVAGRPAKGAVAARAERAPFTGGDPNLIAAIEADVLEGCPKVAWDDIGGLAEAKQALNEAAVLPLLIPDYFVGIREPWKGVLLFGPPGTGKTLLARAVASMGQTTFFNVSASSLVSKYHGESERLCRTLFAMARHHEPSVLFFDEIDALVSARGGATEHEASRRLKSELLSQIDGAGSTVGSGTGVGSGDGEGGGGGGRPLVMLLATSNKPWDLDEAMRRRLERRIYIPLPDAAAREQMLRVNTRGLRLADDLSLAEVASDARSGGYSGADLHIACRDAAMMRMRAAVEGKSPQEIVELQQSGELEGELGLADFEQALARTPPSVSADDLVAFAAWQDEFGSK